MRHQRLFEGHPWLDVVEERARTLSRRRTGCDAFWEYYMFEVSADMYDEVALKRSQAQNQANRK